ncbi:MAG: methylated-DNA--[protein]-cysteine S-methyltransferase [Nitrospiraceae bacterium]|nr:methylated-DNA--[protein]-cysteine S-methyltransferase [Nitrospiraceae bacterium]
MSIFYDCFESPVGPLYLLIKGRELAGVSIRREPSGCRQASAAPALINEFRKYFDGALRTFTYPFVLVDGTPFERSVWLALREIPYGQTRSYKWLAARVGRPQAARAAGQALAKNPLPIVLPCHRVIESDGGLGGYSPALEIKRRLLELEYYRSMRTGSQPHPFLT